MKRTLLMAIGLVLVSAVFASAQTQTGTTPAPRTSQAFVDANGDGICDNFQSGTPQGKGNGQGRGRGLQQGPRDGSGFGPGAGTGAGPGAGTCDGTGPKGGQARRGRR